MQWWHDIAAVDTTTLGIDGIAEFRGERSVRGASGCRGGDCVEACRWRTVRRWHGARRWGAGGAGGGGEGGEDVKPGGIGSGGGKVENVGVIEEEFLADARLEPLDKALVFFHGEEVSNGCAR